MGNHIQILSERVHLIASSSTWIEGNAIQQLQKTAQLDGIIKAVGMPDLHPGRGYPIGAAFLSQHKIYPALVGNDIGCGMALWKTEIKSRKINLDKCIKRLTQIDTPLDSSWATIITERSHEKSRSTTTFDRALGTIGGGNHFAELQQVVDIYQPELFSSLNINHQNLVLLVHSGSRGFGESILRHHVEQFSHQGLNLHSVPFDSYIAQHNQALKFAELNRELIAMRLLQKLHTTGTAVLDINHNLVAPIPHQQECWVHRKGATPSDAGFVVIPGSRGDYSYLVKPIPSEDSLYSLAHGAGRKWMRSECKGRLSKRYTKSDLERTSLGSRVICNNKALLYEEAPEAYKPIDSIIEAMQLANLIIPIARFKPVLTYKTQGECS